ncbi:MAG: MBL fold metallo-hydrolase [Candidatus Rokubacteria bacterium]|nr:MBL fold metallo-hydrolase [Candidatus Rokubacteria bacterium]
MDRLTVGDASVVRIEEMVDTSFTGKGFFPAFDPEALRPHLSWLAPRYYIPERDALVFSMHSWVVKTGRHTVLIDTCIGNDKDRMPREHWHRLRTPFLERLRGSGTAPEDVDYVMCTHLHADHIGWNTVLKDGRWVPTFPNARYLFARVEYEHWRAHPDPNPIRRNGFNDSVLPIVEAGRADMIEDGHEVDGAFTVQLAPGHTPGNVHIRLASKGSEAVFAGDSVHHPIQVYEVHWSTVACVDQAAAAASRLRLLQTCAERRSVLLPAHFASPHAAYVDQAGGKFSLRWLA